MATAINVRKAVAAGADVHIHTQPADTHATVSINFCNAGAEAVRFSFALSSSGTAAAGDYLEFAQTLPPGGTLERTGLVLTQNMQVLVSADVAGLNVQLYGYEE